MRLLVVTVILFISFGRDKYDVLLHNSETIVWTGVCYLQGVLFSPTSHCIVVVVLGSCVQ